MDLQVISCQCLSRCAVIKAAPLSCSERWLTPVSFTLCCRITSFLHLLASRPLPHHHGSRHMAYSKQPSVHLSNSRQPSCLIYTTAHWSMQLLSWTLSGTAACWLAYTSTPSGCRPADSTRCPLHCTGPCWPLCLSVLEAIGHT